MAINLNKLKLVILENPYDAWADPALRELLGSIIGLKLEGYRKEYPYGVLPIDTTDFIGIHHAICEDRNGVLVPLLAYKSVSLARCRTHRLAFPLLSLAQASKAPLQEKAVAEIIQRCESSGRGLSYYGSWTIHPDVRRDEAASPFLRDMMAGLHPLYYQETEREEILTLAVLRFKVPRMFTCWGYQRATWQGEELPTFPLSSLFGEEVAMYHFTGDFPGTALQAAKKFQKLWEERWVIGATDRGAIDSSQRRAA